MQHYFITFNFSIFQLFKNGKMFPFISFCKPYLSFPPYSVTKIFSNILEVSSHRETSKNRFATSGSPKTLSSTIPGFEFAQSEFQRESRSKQKEKYTSTPYLMATPASVSNLETSCCM